VSAEERDGVVAAALAALTSAYEATRDLRQRLGEALDEIERLRATLTPRDGSVGTVSMGNRTFEEMLNERDALKAQLAAVAAARDELAQFTYASSAAEVVRITEPSGATP